MFPEDNQTLECEQRCSAMMLFNRGYDTVGLSLMPSRFITCSFLSSRNVFIEVICICKCFQHQLTALMGSRAAHGVNGRTVLKEGKEAAASEAERFSGNTTYVQTASL